MSFWVCQVSFWLNKLKALKTDLKKWNEEVFGDIGKKKKELLEGIRELDLVEECCA